MGNAIRSTPRDRISKVVLEEKLFQTWHGGRTVLIGDGMEGQVVDCTSTRSMSDRLAALPHVDPFLACHRVSSNNMVMLIVLCLPVRKLTDNYIDRFLLELV